MFDSDLMFDPSRCVDEDVQHMFLLLFSLQVWLVEESSEFSISNVKSKYDGKC